MFSLLACSRFVYGNAFTRQLALEWALQLDNWQVFIISLKCCNPKMYNVQYTSE